MLTRSGQNIFRKVVAKRNGYADILLKPLIRVNYIQIEENSNLQETVLFNVIYLYTLNGQVAYRALTCKLMESRRLKICQASNGTK